MMTKYKVTEYGNRVIPHLLKSLREKNPEAWKILQDAIKELPEVQSPKLTETEQ